MLRSCCLVATCVLAITVGTANATTFNVMGSSSLPMGGTLDINTSTGAVGPADVTVPNPPDLNATAFTHVSTSFPPGPGIPGFFGITLDQVLPGGVLGFSLALDLPVSSLVGYTGGPIADAILFPTATGPEDFVAICMGGACGSLTASTTPPVPGPVAGAGLPGLILAGAGLLGWWRRRQLESTQQSVRADFREARPASLLLDDAERK